MKGSLIVLCFFIAGCMLGTTNLLPSGIQESHLSTYILYALMLQVGISIGSNPNLKAIIRQIRWKFLLIPLATVTGTLLDRKSVV